MNRKITSILFIVLAVSLILCAYCFSASASESEPKVSIERMNLSFEDNVYIKYAVKFEGDETLESSIGMLFWTESRESYEKGTESSAAAPIGYQMIDGEKYYTFSYQNLTAKQMTKVVYARAYVIEDGVYYYSNVKSYSIVDYASNRLGLIYGVEGSTNSDFREMLRAMLEYGTKAQIYFGYCTDNLATDIFKKEYEITVVDGKLTDGRISGVFCAGTELTLVAEEREGFTFTNWEDDNGALVGTDKTQTVIVNSNRTYTAKYKEKVDTGALDFATNDSGATYYVSGIGTWKDSVVTVPETYQGSPVTAIGDYAFNNCTLLTSVEIPSSITYIGRGAFSYCTSIKKVCITDVSKWCSIAFGTASSNPMNCGADLYLNGVLVEKIEMSNEITSIGYAFSGCTSIVSIEIPEGVTSIVDSAFSGCTSLTYIGIPNSVTLIDSYSFQNCMSLTNIEIPEGVTSIGRQAFYGCTSLTSVTIPKSVTYIGFSTFSGCSSLETITVPFVGGNKYTSPENESNTFGYIFGIEKYTGSIATLQKCSSVTRGVEYFIPSSLKKITVTDCDKLYSGAFQNCASLIHIEIPEGITSIGWSAFYGCASLENIRIPDSVAEISSEAFYGCTSLTSIEIPKNVTTIDIETFRDCTALVTIIIPEGVTNIRSKAFYGCTSLIDVEIPESVNTIGDAFNHCTSIKNIVIPNGVTWIASYAFYKCGSLESIEIPKSVTSIGEYAFSSCSSLTNVQLYEGVTSIGKEAFAGCTSLQSIEIPDSVTSIGSWAFHWCTSLTDIKIPEGVTAISSYAFNGCSSLLTVKIPASVTYMGKDAFCNCSSIKTVYYGGTSESWSKVYKYYTNSKLGSATRYYYSESKPGTEGNYWHYDAEGNIVVWGKE
ncbi:MAG: leucine-rich repeat domain-containing protein [Ruminococcaceae bacterium]|nr:leucine-rich repeat domain-containing protein [Oscillospiraceae bacterium]